MLNRIKYCVAVYIHVTSLCNCTEACARGSSQLCADIKLLFRWECVSLCFRCVCSGHVCYIAEWHGAVEERMPGRVCVCVCAQQSSITGAALSAFEDLWEGGEDMKTGSEMHTVFFCLCSTPTLLFLKRTTLVNQYSTGSRTLHLANPRPPNIGHPLTKSPQAQHLNGLENNGVFKKVTHPFCGTRCIL